MCTHALDQKFADMGSPARIWAIPAIHGHYNEILSIHDAIYREFKPGDQLIYLGNYIGYGPHSTEVIDELLTFRRLILSIPGVFASDIVYLRGRQEEMLAKLLQLQFAPEADKVLDWMLRNGMHATMKSYGIDIDRGLRASREGVTGLGTWTKSIHERIKAFEGHDVFRTNLKRAAFTDMESSHPILFVHAGLEPTKALSIQGDHFWWTSENFHTINKPYRPFERVVRGFDPSQGGAYVNGVTATLDDGCGFGGQLVFGLIEGQSGEMNILSA